jgi:hypothetical protein
MTNESSAGGKLPGKTLYAGRRRAMTRSSGFKVHSDTTGGEFRRHAEQIITLVAGQSVVVNFEMNGHAAGDLIGYGLWFWHTAGVTSTIHGGSSKKTLTQFSDPSWNKAGSMWVAEDKTAVNVTFTLSASVNGSVALYEPVCGRVRHKHLDDARKELMRNMYQFAPEALFIEPDDAGVVTVGAEYADPQIGKNLILKSCNRCGRYLPINTPTERDQLSYGNHCVAEHRRPCSHATFGRLRNTDDETEVLQLEYGYQLECRFCKKFEVNAAHNPQRSSAQMKEDGARRRAFELLLAELYKGTPQLRYRHERGTELADDVWRRFSKRCFRCSCDLPTSRDMNLDHTRPLALLWPLDSTATALCGSCNSEKRDRAPVDFYSADELKKLVEITGISHDELTDTRPNEEALQLLIDQLDWFFGEFLMREEMTKERDGKIAGELVVKALQKVLSRSKRFSDVDLQAQYEHRRSRTS